MRFSCGVLVSMLMLAACGKGGDAAGTTVPVAVADPASIPVSLSNYMGSGLANQFPGVLVLEEGNVVAFRHGTEAANAALAAVQKGEKVVDEPAPRQQVQEALVKLLVSEHRTLESVAGPGGKVVILVSPGASLGECPPCTALFGPLDLGAVVGDFKVKKISIEKG